MMLSNALTFVIPKAKDLLKKNKLRLKTTPPTNKTNGKKKKYFFESRRHSFKLHS